MLVSMSRSCPRCGNPAEFHGRLSDLRTGSEVVFLRCDCGWHGTEEGHHIQTSDELLPQREMRD